MFTRILVPTDFSEPSDAALTCARELATRFRASLHLIHVIEDAIVTGPFATDAYVPESPQMTATLRAEAQRHLNERTAEAMRSHLHATSEVRNGTVAPTIVAAASELAIDLIVMGTRGRTGMAHAVMGSVAERVVRMATCPVLTVHAAPQSIPPRAAVQPGVVII